MEKNVSRQDRGQQPLFFTKDRVDDIDRLTGSTDDDQSIVVMRYNRERPHVGLMTPNPPLEMFMAAVHLRDCGARHQWCDGKYISRPATAPGGFSVIDLRHVWQTEIAVPFETVNFMIPRIVIDRLAEEMRAPKVGTLECSDWGMTDPVMYHLALALRPALIRPHEASRLFVDHMVAAASLHLAVAYGGLTPRRSPIGLGLAPRQVSRVKEMILGNLGRSLSLADLADSCGLSQSHFSRAFKQATGETPHRWLIAQRVAKAQRLLAETGVDLADIALETGFADQSHFTRVFSAHVGVTPGAWRRLRRS